MTSPSPCPRQSKAATPKPVVLVYHRVARPRLDNQYLCVAPERFAAQMERLSARRRVLPLTDILAAARAGEAEGCAAVTFDDGYADNLYNALPILERFNVPATVFVTSGAVDDPRGFWGDRLEDAFLSGRSLPPEITFRGRAWPLSTAGERLRAHDEIRWELKSKGLPDEIWRAVADIEAALGLPPGLPSPHPALSAPELLELAASPFIDIGAHGVRHARLSLLDETAQRREIADCKTWLEARLDRAVTHFAYPYGTTQCYDEATRGILRGLGMTGIANTQACLDADCRLQDVPRRLVRDWDAATFAAWLDADEPWRDELEARTVAGREARLLKLMEAAPPALGRGPGRDKGLAVTHINTLAGVGGAAKSTERLVGVQKRWGYDARALVGLMPPPPDCDAVFFEPEPDPVSAAELRERGLLYLEYQGSHRLHAHPLVQGADVLHFQNLHGGFFNPLSVSGLSALKPCVWTLRDMQALTGACAHAFACDAWAQGCGHCPDLTVYPGLPVDSTAELWRLKKLVSEHARLFIVTPSRWLAEKAEKSLLGRHPVSVIVNATDTDVFRPRDKAAARAALGLPRDALILGAVAHGGPLENAWKGGAYTLAATEALARLHPGLLFANVGGGEDAPERPGVVNIPHTRDENRLAEIYSALDLFLYTSLADTCPLVVIEALSCGLPVVSFATGGVPELVRDGVDGRVTPYRDTEALLRAASALVARPALLRRMGRAAREGALLRFGLDRLARQYEAVYAQAMAEARRPFAAAFPPGALPDILRTPAFLELEARKTMERP